MLSVLLTILKIIGIILLCVIGLVLVILLIVLFVPFRYSIRAKREGVPPDAKMTDGLAAGASVTWLLRAVSFTIGYEDGGLKKVLKIFGIDTAKLKKNKKKKKKKKKKPKAGPERTLSEIQAADNKKKHKSAESAAEAVPKDTLTEEAAPSEAVPDGAAESGPAKAENAKADAADTGAADSGAGSTAGPEKGTVEGPETAKDAGGGTPKGAAAESATAPEDGEEESGEPAELTKRTPSGFAKLVWKAAEKIWQLLQKVGAALKKLKKKLDAVKAKVMHYVRFLEDERTKKAIALALKELGKILKGLLPKKGKGYVRYGTGDPYETGKAFAIVAAAYYPLFGNQVQVIPDFEEKRMEGNVELKGRLYLAAIAWAGIKIILNRNIRYCIKFLKNKEEQPNGGQ